MAAELVAPVAAQVQATGAAVKVAVDDWSKDPVMKTATGLVKWGSVLSISGGIMWGFSGPLLQQAQLDRWDMEDTLGLPRTVPPNNAPPPPLAPGPALFLQIVNEATNPDNVNAAHAVSQFVQIQVDLTSLAKLLTDNGKQTAPVGAFAPLVQAGVDCQAAIEALASTPTGWGPAQNQARNLHENLNALGFAMGWGQPFQIPQPGIPSGWWSPYVAIVVQVSSLGMTIGQDVSTVVNDFKAIAGDIGTGLGVLGRFFANAPRVLGDAFGFLGTWSAGELFGAVGPWLMGLGIGMLALGLGIRQFYPKGKARVQLYANARSAKVWNWIDRVMHTRKKVEAVWTEKGTEAQIAAANSEPVYVQSTTPLPSVKVELPGQRARARAVKPSDRPLPMGTPTTEVEDQLGKKDEREPTAEELRKEEEERKRTLPDDKPPDSVQPGAPGTPPKPPEDTTPPPPPESEPPKPPRPPNADSRKDEEDYKRAEEAARQVKVRQDYRKYRADDVLEAAGTFEDRQFVAQEKVGKKRHHRESSTRNLVMTGQAGPYSG
jgi:hypothetical protein